MGGLAPIGGGTIGARRDPLRLQIRHLKWYVAWLNWYHELQGHQQEATLGWVRHGLLQGLARKGTPARLGEGQWPDTRGFSGSAQLRQQGLCERGALVFGDPFGQQRRHGGQDEVHHWVT